MFGFKRVHIVLSALLYLCQTSTKAHGRSLYTHEPLLQRWLTEEPASAYASDDLVVNGTCVQLYITPLGSSCDNVDHKYGDESSSRLRVTLSSMLHACVKFGQDSAVRRLRVMAGSARLYPELRRLGSIFSSASGIPLYFNFSTRAGSSASALRAAIASLPPVVDTEDTSGGVDAFIVSPAYMPSMQQAGKLLDLSQLVASDLQLDWFQINMFMREQMVVYGNKVVGIPVTTSPVFLFYHAPTFRRDGLQVPYTWEQVMALAERYHGKDLNGDGQPDFGICMTPPNCFIDGYLVQWIFASFVQTRGSSDGVFLDPLTMTNLANSSAMEEALMVLRRLRLAGPRVGNCSAFEDQYYLQGRCLLSISSTTTFKSAYAPDAPLSYKTMQGNMGIAQFPGSMRVLDRTTGRLVPCDSTTCPLATVQAPDADDVLRPVNRPSPSNNVVVTINAQSPAKHQFYAYSLFSYLASAEVLGATGAALLLDPRLETSPLRNVDLLPAAQSQWVAAGYHPADVAVFLAACRAAMDNPNQSFEARFPGNLNVTSACSEAAMMYTYATIAKPPPVATAAAAVARVVTAVVQSQGGAAAFAPIYRETLNWVPPAAPPTPPGEEQPGGSGGGGAGGGSGDKARSPVTIIATAVSVPCGVVVLCAVAGWAVWSLRRHRGLRAGVAVAPGAGPDTTLLVTDIQSSTSLWEHLEPEVMNVALSLHHGVMRRAISEWNGYESATEGDSFIIAFHNPTDALFCALAAQQALLDAPWPTGLLQYPPIPDLEGEDDPLLPVTALTHAKHTQANVPYSSRAGGFSPYPRISTANSLMTRTRRVVAGVSYRTTSHKVSQHYKSLTSPPPSAPGPPLVLGPLAPSPRIRGRPREGSDVVQIRNPSMAPALTATVRPVGCDVVGLGPAELPAPINGAAAAANSAASSEGEYSTVYGGGAGVKENGERRCEMDGAGGGVAGRGLGKPVPSPPPPPGRHLGLLPYDHSSTCSDMTPLEGMEEQEDAPEDDFVAGGEGGVAPGPSSPPPLLVGDPSSAEQPGQSERSHSNMTLKYDRITLGSCSSGVEIPVLHTMLTFGATLLASVRILRGRAALTSAAAAVGSPATASATDFSPRVSSPQLLLAPDDISLNNPGYRPPSQSQQRLANVELAPQPLPAAQSSLPPLVAGAAAGATPLFRGLRVRMGMWTGVPNAADVSVNAAARRTQYSGEVIVMAKLVSDTVHGGMVVLAECSRRRLDSDAVRSSRAYVLYSGQHELSTRGAVNGPLHLYTCYSRTLLPRVAVVRPMRTAAELRPGALAAPVGQGVVVEMRVVGIAALLAWNREVAEASLELLHAAATKLLPGSGGGGAAALGAAMGTVAAAATHIVTGATSLLEPGGAGGGGGGSAAAVAAATADGGGGAAAASPGTMVLIFGDADGAVTWASALRRSSREVTWPAELLDHELAEECRSGL